VQPDSIEREPDRLAGRTGVVLRLGVKVGDRLLDALEGMVTLDTVKKHVSHVLGKLGAANRTEAVARARELGLIP
jgi:LuxR family maltose regulon positive regulatory protein